MNDYYNTLKRAICTFGTFILLLACKSDRIYKIEGRLSNLNNTVLYAVFETSGGNRIDTIRCDEKGSFAVLHEQDDDLQTVTFYYNEREDHFTVYPSEDGKTIQVKGDAKFPQLIQAKGGRINNKLSEFKKQAESILLEQVAIPGNRNDNRSSNGKNSSLFANINLELKKAAQEFITQNPKEEASIILINEYFLYPEDVALTEYLLDLISPELNDRYLVKNLKTHIAKTKTTIMGAKAPAFNVTNIYGNAITPDTFLNKYYILAFMALWCDMCRTGIMMLDDIATEYPKDSLEILLISLDDETEEVRNMILQDSIKWNLVTDSAGQAMNLFEIYNINSLPQCFLIDKDGMIKLRTNNGMELKQTVDEIMK